jgi:dolichyl-phosphate-mannose--protein O-mannosyl transferase
LIFTTKSALIGAAFALLVFWLQGTFFIRANSQTVDEAMHLVAGYSYLATKDFRLEPQNPPLIKQLLALPLFVFYRLPFDPDPEHWRDGDGYLMGRDFLYKSAVSADEILALSRFANLFLGGILILLTGWWAYRLWGNKAAMLAIGLASLEPNFVAHSSLITTDIGLTLVIFLTVYVLWEYLNSFRWWLLVATGISAGMALVSKFSGILVIPILALMIASSFWSVGILLIFCHSNRTLTYNDIRSFRQEGFFLSCFFLPLVRFFRHTFFRDFSRGYPAFPSF